LSSNKKNCKQQAEREKTPKYIVKTTHSHGVGRYPQLEKTVVSPCAQVHREKCPIPKGQGLHRHRRECWCWICLDQAAI
jgi:hypothetical protein